MKAPTPLTARFVDTVNEPGRYGDGRGGHGLILNVHRMLDHRISRSWIQRLKISGRVTHLGLGSYPVVTLAEARKAALANRRMVAKGVDPRTGGVPTFAAALDAVIAIQLPTWRNPKTEAQWRASLRNYASALMTKPVDSIAPGDVLAVLTPIWTTKRETAQRVKRRIGAVMKQAIAEGHRTDNPVDAIGAALPKNGAKREHFKALPYADVSGALAAVRTSAAYPTTRLAFELLVLTAARSGEVRGATWSEIDMDTATWTIPAERMKMDRDHRVPLSPRAVEILTEARQYSDASGLVFPSARGKVMSDMTLSKMVKSLGIEAVPHGFRSSFRDWANERTNTPHAVMEAALAHVVRDKTVAAYSRSDHLDKRRSLIDGWARYITAESCKVVAIA
ncbi:MAG: site-specific integrase [Thiotrichales bacterium]|nr:site-specific integrase [Thiotrichales bacterium]